MDGRSFLPWLLLAVAALAACGGAPEVRPNVLLITVDTLRADHLSAYGYQRIRTPNIDRLAAEGALFENAVADTPWTTPSMSSVMTGTYATIHGFKSTNANRLARENVTLAEILKEAGYTTAAVVGSFPLDAIFQLDQGFDHYDDEFTTPIWIYPDHEFEHVESRFFESPDEQRFFMLSKALNDSRREDAEVTDAALAWLSAEPDEPYFLWVHYFGPHEKPDWTVPEQQRERRHLRMYDPATLKNDREVGRLLEAVDAQGLRDDTLVVFHADHGESLGEEGLIGHGQLLNAASMRIPLIMRYPERIAAGVRVSRLVRNVDVFPTVLDAVGIANEKELSGTSLLPLVGSAPRRALTAMSEPFRGDPVAYMETYYPAHVAYAAPLILPSGEKVKVGVIRRGIQTPHWKFVRTEPHPLIDVTPGSVPEAPAELLASLVSEELYDLSVPAREARNVIDEHPAIADEMRAVLERQLQLEKAAGPSARVDVDAETKLRLKSLGYSD